MKLNIGRKEPPQKLDDPEDSNDDTKIFSYDPFDEFGPQNWDRINKNCAGHSQSPVHLHDEQVKIIKKPLKIDGLDLKPEAITVINNGHGAGMKFEFPKSEVYFYGGPLKQPYILINIHWHWGKTNVRGSEHALHGKLYSAEVHFVSYNSKYGEH